MRSRVIVLLALVLTATALLAAPASGAITLAQSEPEEGTEVENEGGDQSDAGTDTGEGADSSQGEEDLEGGEGAPDAETGAGEDEQAPAAEEEEGPQWTYQMSKITLVMLLLLFLAMGALYYRMIARRQRGV